MPLSKSHTWGAPKVHWPSVRGSSLRCLSKRQSPGSCLGPKYDSQLPRVLPRRRAWGPESSKAVDSAPSCSSHASSALGPRDLLSCEKSPLSLGLCPLCPSWTLSLLGYSVPGSAVRAVGFNTCSNSKNLKQQMVR